MDAVKTIDPPPLSIIAGIACLAQITNQRVFDAHHFVEGVEREFDHAAGSTDDSLRFEADLWEM